MELEVVEPIPRYVGEELVAGAHAGAKTELNLVRAGGNVCRIRLFWPVIHIATRDLPEHLAAIARDADEVVAVPLAPPRDRGRPDDCSRESADVPCLYTRAQRDAVERLLRLDAKGRRTGHGHAPLEVSKPHCIPNVAPGIVRRLVRHGRPAVRDRDRLDGLRASQCDRARVKRRRQRGRTAVKRVPD